MHACMHIFGPGVRYRNAPHSTSKNLSQRTKNNRRSSENHRQVMLEITCASILQVQQHDETLGTVAIVLGAGAFNYALI